MIVAIILADFTQPLIRGHVPYLLPMGDETVIERIARVVLRGPFGGTIVASAASFHSEVRSALEGFAVQHVALGGGGGELQSGSAGAAAQALKFAESFRVRWEKAMAAAAERFGAGDDDEDDDAPQTPPGARKPRNKKAADWASHSRSADVKVRGLARSFERDGVILFRGDCPLIAPDLQAQVVEAFARDAPIKAKGRRPFAQAVHNGLRGYPLVIERAAIPELLALPPQTVFDDWLLAQLPRIQDVPVQDGAILQRIGSDEDYENILGALE